MGVPSGVPQGRRRRWFWGSSAKTTPEPSTTPLDPTDSGDEDLDLDLDDDEQEEDEEDTGYAPCMLPKLSQ